mgnify:CR=1 FL=1
MKAKLIAIGNSKGVRLPRAVIDECGFGEEIELRVERGTVVLAPARGAREGWDDAFRGMAAEGDDAPLLPDRLEHDWDEEEWEW